MLDWLQKQLKQQRKVTKMKFVQILAGIYNQFVVNSEIVDINQPPRSGEFYGPTKNEKETGLWMNIVFGVFAGNFENSAVLLVYDPSEPVSTEPGTVYLRFTAYDTDNTVTSDITITRKVGSFVDGPKKLVCMEICRLVEQGRKVAHTPIDIQVTP